jgi:genome maintenance exonuclease 1
LSEAAIADWRKRVGEAQAAATSKRASERGTALHEAVERFLKNEDTSDITPATRILLNRARLTLRRISNITAQEIALWSDEMEVAGRCDCIADFDGIPSIIDFKTSDRIKKVDWIKGYFQQATGYSMMWQERTGRIVEQIVIIIVGDDGSCKPYVETRADYISPLRETVAQYKATH